MGIPIVEGRAFELADLARGPAVVINEALAERFFRGRNAVGGRLSPNPEQFGWFTVIGIAKDVKQGGVDQKTGTEIYFLAEQAAAAGFPERNMNVVVRSALAAASLRSVVEAAVRETDATLPIIRYRAMDEVFAESVSRPRLLANLLAAFAGLALLLAALGTYGILSYMVSERRREIGIRMALGARAGEVVGMVVRRSLWPIGAGIAAGVSASLAASRLLGALLYGVTPYDPVVLGAIVAILGGSAVAACLVPARRAASVDPLVVLKEE
jgi:putative ABC transport system permease protein